MKKIFLAKNKYALVDDDDYEALSKHRWYVCKSRYNTYAVGSAIKNGRHKTTRMHREIMRPSKCMQVDHIDGDGLNNQKSNLRIVTNSQNQMNVPTRRDNKSGFKGVFLRKDCNAWRAYIDLNYMRVHLGNFKSKEEACRARQKASAEFHGEFART